MQLDTRFKGYVIAHLRKIFRWWPARKEAKRRAETEDGQFVCESCAKVCTSRGVHVDHIAPVVDPTRGFTTWDEYIDRLFCDSENLQILCKSCHSVKTKEERKVRDHAKKKKKTDEQKGKRNKTMVSPKKKKRRSVANVKPRSPSRKPKSSQGTRKKGAVKKRSAGTKGTKKY